jgi:hypothetical protein
LLSVRRTGSSPKEPTTNFSIVYVLGPLNRRGPGAAASAGALSTPTVRHLFACISSPVNFGIVRSLTNENVELLYTIFCAKRQYFYRVT